MADNEKRAFWGQGPEGYQEQPIRAHKKEDQVKGQSLEPVISTLKPDFELPDSGQRQQFETGAVRDTEENKGRYDLMATQGLMRLAIHYERGARKYADRNWEKGIPIKRCLNSAIRHLVKYMAGWNDEDHLAAAAWNIFAIMHFELYKPELQDLPTRQTVTPRWTIFPPGEENAK